MSEHAIQLGHAGNVPSSAGLWKCVEQVLQSKKSKWESPEGPTPILTRQSGTCLTRMRISQDFHKGHESKGTEGRVQKSCLQVLAAKTFILTGDRLLQSPCTF